MASNPVQALIATPRQLLDKFLFKVENVFLKDTGFRDMGELGCDVQLVEHYQGGALVPDLGPGLGKFTTITLRRGATRNIVELEAWFERVLNGNVRAPLSNGGGLGAGFADPLGYKVPTRIVSLDRAKNSQTVWTLYDSFPIVVRSVEGFDNTANERAIESITLAYSSYERTSISGVKLNLQVGLPGIASAQFGRDFSGLNIPGTTIPAFNLSG